MAISGRSPWYDCDRRASRGQFRLKTLMAPILDPSPLPAAHWTSRISRGQIPSSSLSSATPGSPVGGMLPRPTVAGSPAGWPGVLRCARAWWAYPVARIDPGTPLAASSSRPAASNQNPRRRGARTRPPAANAPAQPRGELHLSSHRPASGRWRVPGLATDDGRGLRHAHFARAAVRVRPGSLFEDAPGPRPARAGPRAQAPRPAR